MHDSVGMSQARMHTEDASVTVRPHRQDEGAKQSG